MFDRSNNSNEQKNDGFIKNLGVAGQLLELCIDT